MLKEFNHQIETEGIETAVHSTIAKFGGTMFSYFQRGARSALMEGPAVIISNHPQMMIPASILATLPPRKDFWIVGSSFYKKLGEGFANHLIPIDVVNKAGGPVGRWITGKTGLRKGNLDVSKARSDNIKSIQTAAEKINNGGRVLIFPDNVHRQQQSWFPGVGQILKEVLPETNIVMAHVRGELGLHRLLPGLRSHWPLHAEVSYSSPITLEKLANQVDLTSEDVARRITSILEDTYRAKLIYKMAR